MLAMFVRNLECVALLASYLWSALIASKFIGHRIYYTLGGAPFTVKAMVEYIIIVLTPLIIYIASLHDKT
jgi:hypothetical protein